MNRDEFTEHELDNLRVVAQAFPVGARVVRKDGEGGTVATAAEKNWFGTDRYYCIDGAYIKREPHRTRIWVVAHWDNGYRYGTASPSNLGGIRK